MRISDQSEERHPLVAYATMSDYEACRQLHRKYGTTYYFASRCLPFKKRREVDAVYGFIRMADEWVDNPGHLTREEQLRKLRDYRSQFLDGMAGCCPDEGVLRAFTDVARSSKMPPEEPLVFLEAMEMDLEHTRYRTYSELQRYMRGSASAVGIMLCYVLGVPRHPMSIDAAVALGEALQLTNCLRDVGEDAKRGRIYIPQEDLELFGVSEEDILNHCVTENFKQLMKFEIARARTCYEQADLGIPFLPKSIKMAVLAARVLYCKILDSIEKQDYDVFSKRAHTTSLQKMITLLKLCFNKQVYQAPSIKEE